MRTECKVILVSFIISTVHAQGWDTVITEDVNQPVESVSNQTQGTKQTYSVRYEPVDPKRDDTINVRGEPKLFKLSKDSPQAKQTIVSSGVGQNDGQGSTGTTGLTVDSNISPYNTYIEPIAVQVSSDGSIMYNDMLHASIKDTKKQNSITQEITSTTDNYPKNETREDITASTVTQENNDDQTKQETFPIGNKESTSVVIADTVPAENSQLPKEAMGATDIVNADIVKTNSAGNGVIVQDQVGEIAKTVTGNLQPVTNSVGMESGDMVNTHANESFVVEENIDASKSLDNNVTKETIETGTRIENAGIIIPDALLADLPLAYSTTKLHNDKLVSNVESTKIFSDMAFANEQSKLLPGNVIDVYIADESLNDTLTDEPINVLETTPATELPVSNQMKDQTFTAVDSVGNTTDLTIKDTIEKHTKTATDATTVDSIVQDTSSDHDQTKAAVKKAAGQDNNQGSVEQEQMQTISDTNAIQKQPQSGIETVEAVETPVVKEQTQLDSAALNDKSQAIVNTEQTRAVVDTIAVNDHSEAVVNAVVKQVQAKPTVGSIEREEKTQAVVDSVVGQKQTQNDVDSVLGQKQTQAVVDSVVGQEETQNAVESVVGQQETQAVVDSVVGQEQTQNAVESVVGQQETQGVVDSVNRQEQKQAVVDSVNRQEQTHTVVDSVVGQEQTQNAVESVVGQEETQAVVDSVNRQEQTQAVVDSVNRQEQTQAVVDSVVGQENSQAVVDSGVVQEQTQTVVDSVVGQKQTQAVVNSVDGQEHTQTVVDSAVGKEQTQTVVDSVAGQEKTQNAVDSVVDQEHTQAVVDSVVARVHSQAVVDSGVGQEQTHTVVDSVVGQEQTQAIVDSVVDGQEQTQAVVDLSLGQEQKQAVVGQGQTQGVVDSVIGQNNAQVIIDSVAGQKQTQDVVDPGAEQDQTQAVVDIVTEKEQLNSSTVIEKDQGQQNSGKTINDEVNTPGAVGIVIPNFLFTDTIISNQQDTSVTNTSATDEGASETIQKGHVKANKNNSLTGEDSVQTSPDLTVGRKTALNSQDNPTGHLVTPIKDTVVLEDTQHKTTDSVVTKEEQPTVVLGNEIAPQNKQATEEQNVIQPVEEISNHYTNEGKIKEEKSQNVITEVAQETVKEKPEITVVKGETQIVTDTVSGKETTEAVIARSEQRTDIPNIGVPVFFDIGMVEQIQGNGKGISTGTTQTNEIKSDVRFDETTVTDQVKSSTDTTANTDALVQSETVQVVPTQSPKTAQTYAKPLISAESGLDTRIENDKQTGVDMSLTQAKPDAHVVDAAQYEVKKDKQVIIDTQTGIETLKNDEAQPKTDPRVQTEISQGGDAIQTLVDMHVVNPVQTVDDTLVGDAALTVVDKPVVGPLNTEENTQVIDAAKTVVGTHVGDAGQTFVDSQIVEPIQTVADTQVGDSVQAVIDTTNIHSAEPAVDKQLTDASQTGIDTTILDAAQTGVDTQVGDADQTFVDTQVVEQVQTVADTQVGDAVQAIVDTTTVRATDQQVDKQLTDAAQTGIDTKVLDTAQSVGDTQVRNATQTVIDLNVFDQTKSGAGQVSKLVDTQIGDADKLVFDKHILEEAQKIVDIQTGVNSQFVNEALAAFNSQYIKEASQNESDTAIPPEESLPDPVRIASEIVPEQVQTVQEKVPDPVQTVPEFVIGPVQTAQETVLDPVQIVPEVVPDQTQKVTAIALDPNQDLIHGSFVPQADNTHIKAEMVVEGAVLDNAVPGESVTYTDPKPVVTGDKQHVSVIDSKNLPEKESANPLKPQTTHLLENVLTGKPINDKQIVSTIQQPKQVADTAGNDVTTGDLKAEFQDLGITPSKKETGNNLLSREADHIGNLDQDPIQDVTETIQQTETSGLALESLCEHSSFIDSIGYAEYPGRCDKLVQCYNYRGRDIAVLRDCPYGYFWHQEQVLCRPPAEVPCYDDPCLDIDIVQYNRSGGCRSYYACEYGISIPQCCDKGFRFNGRRCIPDATCYDPCSTPFDIEQQMRYQPCKFLPDEYNPYGYITMEHNGLRIRACPSGTVFNARDCGCRSIGKGSPKYRQSRRRMRQCKPQFAMDFDQGFKEDSGSNMAFDVNNVVITNRAAQFDGKGKITLWGFMNRELGTRFAIRLRFKPDPTSTDRGSLISNCGMTGSPTVSIDLQKHMLVSSAKSKSFTEPTKIKDHFDPYSWNDITYVYDGRNFMVLTNGYKQRKPLGGLLETRSNAIVIGGCPRPGKGYKGLIDSVEIYSGCIPRDILKKRNRR